LVFIIIIVNTRNILYLWEPQIKLISIQQPATFLLVCRRHNLGKIIVFKIISRLDNIINAIINVRCDREVFFTFQSIRYDFHSYNIFYHYLVIILFNHVFRFGGFYCQFIVYKQEISFCWFWYYIIGNRTSTCFKVVWQSKLKASASDVIFWNWFYVRLQYLLTISFEKRSAKNVIIIL